MFAISKFRIGALIQSNIPVICRSFATSKPQKPRNTLNYRFFSDKPWILFIRKERGNAFDFGPKELKEISEQYHKLPEDEKRESKIIWKLTHGEFDKLPKELQDSILKEDKEISDALNALSNEKSQFFEDTNHPVRPVKPAKMYLRERYPDKPDKDANDEFAKLSDEEKKPYNDRYEKEHEIYKIDEKKWKEMHGKTWAEKKKKYAPYKKRKANIIKFYRNLINRAKENYSSQM